MILSDRSIREEVAAGRIVIDPFDDACVQPSSIDLHVDRQFRVFQNNRYPFIDVMKEQPDLTELVEVKEGEPFILHPGEFVLGSTLERVALPDDLVARLEGKSSLGRLGLLIHSTAGYVDPGWDGYLTLELSNVANLPITIYPGMKIGQISFFRLDDGGRHAVRVGRQQVPGPAGPDGEQVLPGVRRRSRERSALLRAGDRSRHRPHAQLHGHHRGLRPVRDAELAEDRRQVGLHRLLRQVEVLRDRPVAPALGEQRQDVVLPLRQVVLGAANTTMPVRGLAPRTPRPRTGSGSRGATTRSRRRRSPR